MARVQALTPRQEAILRWVRQGCPDGVMQGDGHRISAAALRTRGLIRISGRGASWSAKLTGAGQAYLEQLDNVGGAADRAGAPERSGARYHPAVRALRDSRERHEVSRSSLTRALRLAQLLAAAAEERNWIVRAASESENSYGVLDWTGAKDGHLELEVADQTLRLRIHEEGVHARGRWEEQVARFADVPADSPMREEAPLPEGDYDQRGTGRLKLELQWGPWWTRQQTRWADSATVELEERVDEVLAEVARRATGAARIAPSSRTPEDEEDGGLPTLGAAPSPSPRERLRHVYLERAREQIVDEHFGAVLGDEARRFEQAQRVRRYLDAMEHAYGEYPETAAWIAWGRAHADRLDPLSGRASPPGQPPAPEVTPELLESRLPEGFGAAAPGAGDTVEPA